MYLYVIIYHNDDLSLPIFRSGAGKPKSTKEIPTTILQHPPSLKVCKSTPTYVNKNLEFIVDTSHLLHWKDVRSDTISGLVRSGTKTIFLAGDGDNLEQVKGVNYDYRCIRYTYNYNDSPDFHKIIVAVCVGNSTTPLPHFYVQYYFDHEEYPISFTKSHGNSKNPTKIIQHTAYSVRNQIKSLASEGIKGKEIFNRVIQSAGGFEGANSSAELPASYTQIYDISRKIKLKEGKVTKDQIMELIDMCNCQKGTPTMFLREVRTAPELSLVLANERQLDDIERFELDRLLQY